MGIYLFTLFGSVLLAHLAEYYTDGSTDEHGRKKLNSYMVTMLTIFLVVISGFRYTNYYASDEYNYRIAAMAMEGSSINSIRIGIQNEWIFELLKWISANVFHDSQFLVFICALITNVSIVLFFKKYARPFWFSVFLYVCGGSFFTSMNIMRQYLALAIVIWCYFLAREKKFIKYILLILLAAGIHQSVWIMLPMYFLLRKEKMDISFFIILVASLVVMMNFETVMTVILSGSSTYEHYIDDLLNDGYGVKLLRILAWLLPYMFVILFHKTISQRFHLEYSLIFATILAACVSVISYQYVFIARLDVYFSIPALCAVIKVPELFETRSRKFVKYAMVGLFFAFGCYQMMNFAPYHNVLFENISGVLYL